MHFLILAADQSWKQHIKQCTIFILSSLFVIFQALKKYYVSCHFSNTPDYKLICFKSLSNYIWKDIFIRKIMLIKTLFPIHFRHIKKRIKIGLCFFVFFKEFSWWRKAIISSDALLHFISSFYFYSYFFNFFKHFCFFSLYTQGNWWHWTVLEQRVDWCTHCTINSAITMETKFWFPTLVVSAAEVAAAAVVIQSEFCSIRNNNKKIRRKKLHCYKGTTNDFLRFRGVRKLNCLFLGFIFLNF